jgi:hypothetical protein
MKNETWTSNPRQFYIPSVHMACSNADAAQYTGVREISSTDSEDRGLSWWGGGPPPPRGSSVEGAANSAAKSIL